MNEGQPLNGENHNNFPLMRRPSSAIERAAPGAKRIISGMVADTLALAKPVFTVLACDDQISDVAEAVIENELKNRFTLRFLRFKSATELLRLTGEPPFDLIFMYLGNVEWDIGTGHRFNEAIELLGRLKEKFVKPIIATQGMDLRKEFEDTGVIFLEAPFSIEAFRDVLKASFPVQFTDALALVKMHNLSAGIKPAFCVAICGYYDEGLNEILGAHIQEWLSDKFAVKVNPFRHADEFIKAARLTPVDLLFVLLNPGLRKSRDQTGTLDQSDTLELVANLKAEFKIPIIVMSNEIKFDRTMLPSFIKSGANAFLLMPYSISELSSALTACGLNPLELEK